MDVINLQKRELFTALMVKLMIYENIQFSNMFAPFEDSFACHFSDETTKMKWVGGKRGEKSEVKIPKKIWSKLFALVSGFFVCFPSFSENFNSCRLSYDVGNFTDCYRCMDKFFTFSLVHPATRIISFFDERGRITSSNPPKPFAIIEHLPTNRRQRLGKRERWRKKMFTKAKDFRPFQFILLFVINAKSRVCAVKKKELIS